jgi:hypothetical protein
MGFRKEGGESFVKYNIHTVRSMADMEGKMRVY